MEAAPITKEAVLAAFDDSPVAVARFFGIKPQAVHQWPDGQAIPELRQYQLRARRPEVFGPAPEIAAPAEPSKAA